MNAAETENLETLTAQLDMRALKGEPCHVETLREWLYRTSAEHPSFLRTLAAHAVRTTPPLGHSSDFSEDEIDLKHSGARLFVDAARVLALQCGARSTTTAERMRQAAPHLGINDEELAAIIDGFHFIQMLRLRRRHLESDYGAASDNRINPDSLNELDRRILKEALRQVRKLQLQLHTDHQL